MTHIVFDVAIRPCVEQYPAALVVPVLAREMQGGKSAFVLQVEMGTSLDKHNRTLAVALPAGLVEGSVAMLGRKINDLLGKRERECSK